MRTIRVFVLRLLTDAGEPGSLRGSLRSVSNDAEYSFTDAQTLLRALTELSSGPESHGELPNAPQNDDEK